MSDVVEIERSSFKNLIDLLEVIHTESSLISWDTECSMYLEKLGYEINQMKLLLGSGE